MRNKFNTKLHIKPEQHKQFRLFMMRECEHLIFEEGLEDAVRLCLSLCKDKKFREQFLTLPPPPTGVNKGTKGYIYWLNESLKQPIVEMCEIFRGEFGLTTISFGRNAFLYRAICYFIKTKGGSSTALEL